MECQHRNAWLGPVASLAVVLVLVSVVVMYRSKIAEVIGRNNTWLNKLGQRLVLFIVCLQIITVLKVNHDSMEGAKFMAEPYNTYLKLASVFDLKLVQLLPLNCFSDTYFDHFYVLVTTTLVPPVAAFSFFFTAWLVSKSSAGETAKSATGETRKKVFMQALLFAYPPISRTICQSFRCSDFDDDGKGRDVSFLTADMSIDCSEDRYWAMVVYANLCVLIYSVGIPLVLFLKLFKWRNELNPGYEDEERAIRVRMKQVEMLADPFIDFAIRFRPARWWYEIYSLGRRFALTSAVLAFDTLAGSTVYVLAVAGSSLVLDREWAAYIDSYTFTLNHALNIQVMMVPLYMLLVDAGMLRGDYSVAISAGLFAMDLMMISAMIGAATQEIHQEKVKAKQLKAMRVQLNVDKAEDIKKVALFVIGQLLPRKSTSST